jgi:hypothetical protein
MNDLLIDASGLRLTHCLPKDMGSAFKKLQVSLNDLIDADALLLRQFSQSLTRSEP